jgi:hypothetical protein
MPTNTSAATASTQSASPEWKLDGHVILACNCDFGCPCNFNGLPTPGKCEGNWNWYIESGRFGDISLDGLTIGVAVNWPGAIHEGNGDAIVVLDERANEAQRDALMKLVSGQVGGPWKIISTTISKVNGPEFARFEVKVDGFRSSVHAGDFLTLVMEPVRNKTTGAEVHPRAILPEGFVFKDAELGASSTFKVSGPVSFDHSGRYAAAAEFHYQGP